MQERFRVAGVAGSGAKTRGGVRPVARGPEQALSETAFPYFTVKLAPIRNTTALPGSAATIFKYQRDRMTFRPTQPRACHHTYPKNRLDSLRGVSVITVHLQGAAAIFRVGRHKIIMDHYVKVGASHTPSQTHLPLTSRVATHSPLGAQPRSDRILRLPCGRLGPAAPYMYVLDALKRACRSSSQ